MTIQDSSEFVVDFLSIWQIYSMGMFGFPSIKEIRDCLDRSELVQGVDPRDALFGGRVNRYKFFAKAKQDETIEYVDFT